MQQALSGTEPVFTPAHGTRPVLKRGHLRLEQDGAKIVLAEDGTVVVSVPAIRRDREDPRAPSFAHRGGHTEHNCGGARVHRLGSGSCGLAQASFPRSGFGSDRGWIDLWMANAAPNTLPTHTP